MEGTYFDMRKVIILALAGEKNHKMPVKFVPRTNDIFFSL
jgi:hypothetical protein